MSEIEGEGNAIAAEVGDDTLTPATSRYIVIQRERSKDEHTSLWDRQSGRPRTRTRGEQTDVRTQEI